MKGLLFEGQCGPTWAKVERIFEDGSEKVVPSFDHVFNVESAEAGRALEMPERWQLKPSNSTSLTGALVCKVVERLHAQIGGFINLHDMNPALMVVSQYTADQLDHTDFCRDPSVLPLVDGQVSGCHLSTFLVLSSEYQIVVQLGSAYIEVSDTRFNELHLTQGYMLVVTSTCRHHGTPPPQIGCHAKV